MLPLISAERERGDSGERENIKELARASGYERIIISTRALGYDLGIITSIRALGVGLGCLSTRPCAFYFKWA